MSAPRVLLEELEALEMQLRTMVTIIGGGIKETKAPIPPPPPPPGGPHWWIEYRRLLGIVERTNKVIENGFGQRE